MVPLGSHALRHWFPHERISKVHGTTQNYQNIRSSPQYHPAAALHNRSVKSVLRADFKSVASALNDTNQHSEDRANEVLPSEYQIGLL